MKNGYVILVAFVMILIVAVIILFRRTGRDINEKQTWRNQNLMKIQFKGKIIKTKQLTRTGRYHDIACLQLDYCNLDSCYYYIADLVFLKIKNGKAVMQIPSGTSNGKIDYVEVNIDQSGKEKFFKNGKLEDSYDVELSSAGLLKEDLWFCDEIDSVLKK